MRFVWALPLALCLFFMVAASLRAGWAIGRRRIESQGEEANQGLGTVDAAIFGMMGLLLAFTFTGAAGRFDQRRELVVDEVNAIGTAWLRLDLLPADARAELRDLFRQYLDARIATYDDITDRQRIDLGKHAAMALQTRIWDRLVAAVREDRSMPIAQTVLPPVNDMFDIAQKRVLAPEMHPPLAIYLMLGLMVLVSAFLAGFGQGSARRQSLTHLAGFAATTAIAFYLIIDLEYPRLGFIRVNDFDQVLVDLRASMD